MMFDLKQTVNFLKENDNYLFICHINPDGDTLGSATALARGLAKLGKKSKIICADEITADYQFLFEGLTQSEEDFEKIVAVDVADPKLFGDEYNALYGDRVDLCIDHHPTNVNYAKNLYLEANSASTAEMIYCILEEMGVEFTKEIASCLFTGVTTDTGCFRFSNTTVRTYEIAAKLVAFGADSKNIIRTFFETKTKTYVALERLALESMRYYFDDRCAVIFVTQDMYTKSGSNDTETTNLANIPKQIEGVLVGVLMRELKDGSFKTSIRTHGDIDASEIAGRLGGGGHIGAAACTINAPKQQALNLLLKEVQAQLETI